MSVEGVFPMKASSGQDWISRERSAFNLASSVDENHLAQMLKAERFGFGGDSSKPSLSPSSSENEVEGGSSVIEQDLDKPTSIKDSTDPRGFLPELKASNPGPVENGLIELAEALGRPNEVFVYDESAEIRIRPFVVRTARRKGNVSVYLPELKENEACQDGVLVPLGKGDSCKDLSPIKITDATGYEGDEDFPFGDSLAALVEDSDSDDYSTFDEGSDSDDYATTDGDSVANDEDDVAGDDEHATSDDKDTAGDAEERVVAPDEDGSDGQLSMSDEAKALCDELAEFDLDIDQKVVCKADLPIRYSPDYFDCDPSDDEYYGIDEMEELDVFDVSDDENSFSWLSSSYSDDSSAWSTISSSPLSVSSPLLPERGFSLFLPYDPNPRSTGHIASDIGPIPRCPLFSRREFCRSDCPFVHDGTSEVDKVVRKLKFEDSSFDELDDELQVHYEFAFEFETPDLMSPWEYFCSLTTPEEEEDGHTHKKGPCAPNGLLDLDACYPSAPSSLLKEMDERAKKQSEVDEQLKALLGCQIVSDGPENPTLELGP